MYIPSFSEQLHWYNEKKIVYLVTPSKKNKLDFEIPIQNRASFLLGIFKNSRRVNNETIEETQTECLNLLKEAGQLIDSATINHVTVKKDIFMISDKKEIDYSSYYDSSDSDYCYMDCESSSDYSIKEVKDCHYKVNDTYSNDLSSFDSNNSDEFYEYLDM